MAWSSRNGGLPEGWWRCSYCGKPLPPEVYRHTSKRCPGYADLWAMDVYVVLGENAQEYNGEGAIFTITAPGAEWLPWDEDHCANLGPHKHSGKLGCRVDPKMGSVWNETAQERFSKCHRKCKQRADYALGKAGYGKRLSKLFGWWEMQKRGVLHRHETLPMATPAERYWSVQYVKAWNELAPRHWFGFVDRKLSPVAAESLARYCAGYTLGGGGKESLATAVKNPEMPGRTFHVNVKLTQKSGVTMRMAKLNRRVYAARQGLVHYPVLTASQWEKAMRFALRQIFREYGAQAEMLLAEALAEIPAEARAP